MTYHDTERDVRVLQCSREVSNEGVKWPAEDRPESCRGITRNSDGHGLIPIALTKAVSRPKGQAHDSVQQCATVGNFETFGGSSLRGPVMRGPLECD